MVVGSVADAAQDYGVFVSKCGDLRGRSRGGHITFIVWWWDS